MNTAQFVKLHKLDEPHIFMMVADSAGLPITIPAKDATYYLLPFDALIGAFGDHTSEEMEFKLASQSKAMRPYAKLHTVVEKGVAYGYLSPGMLLRFVPDGKYSGELEIGEVTSDWQDVFNGAMITYLANCHQLYAQEMDEIELQTGSFRFDRLALDDENPRE